MVRIMKKDGNRLEGIGERITVRLTLLEEALGMTPGDPEIYGNWIASKAPEPGNVISERVFFKVDGDWYVDDVREADGAKAKRRERRRRDFYRNSSPRSFHPTKAFLDKWVRGMYGWKNVKPSDVVITRETCAEGTYYRVRKTVGKGDWFSVTSFGKR